MLRSVPEDLLSLLESLAPVLLEPACLDTVVSVDAMEEGGSVVVG